MISKSMENLSEDTIAKTLGLVGLRHKLNQNLLSQLHPRVIEAYDKRKIRKVTVEDLTFVKPERQAEILDEMKRVSDYRPPYARTLVLRTPPPLRNMKTRGADPWDQSARQRKELTSKLEDAEKRYDFYSMLYRQYVSDLLRLSIYVRKLISNEKISAHLQANHPEIFDRFQTIVFESEGGR